MDTVSLDIKTEYPTDMTLEIVKDSLAHEIEISKFMLDKNKKKIMEFEKKYKMTSDDFYQKFENGKVGDNEEFFEWFAYIEYCRDWQKKYDILKGAFLD